MAYRFNNLQIGKLADICGDIGLVSLASVVLPAIFNKLDKELIVVGIIVSFLSWAASLWFLKGGDSK